MLETVARRITSETSPPTLLVPQNATTIVNATGREPAKWSSVNQRLPEDKIEAYQPNQEIISTIDMVSALVKLEALAIKLTAKMVDNATMVTAHAEGAGRVTDVKPKTSVSTLNAKMVVLAVKENVLVPLVGSVRDVKLKIFAWTLSAVRMDNVLREPVLAKMVSMDQPAKRKLPAQVPSISSEKLALLPDVVMTATAMVKEPVTGSSSAKEMLETVARRITSETSPPTLLVLQNATTIVNAMGREPAKWLSGARQLPDGQKIEAYQPNQKLISITHMESAMVKPEVLAMEKTASMEVLAPTEFASAKQAGKV
jgi:hypothetical protein